MYRIIYRGLYVRENNTPLLFPKRKMLDYCKLLYFFPPPKKLLSMSPMASAGSFAASPVFLSLFFPTSSSDTSLSAASKT